MVRLPLPVYQTPKRPTEKRMDRMFCRSCQGRTAGGLRAAIIIMLAGVVWQPGIATAKNNHCPPGLAKKSPPCVPPGLAKKDRAWGTGDRIYGDDLHWITRPGRYGLPELPAGQRYVVAGNQVYAVDEGTYQVITVLNAIEAILD